MTLGAFPVTVNTPIQYCHFFVVAVVPSPVPVSEVILLHPLSPSIPTSCHTWDSFHTSTRQPDMAIPAYPPSFVPWGMIKQYQQNTKWEKATSGRLSPRPLTIGVNLVGVWIDEVNGHVKIMFCQEVILEWPFQRGRLILVESAHSVEEKINHLKLA